jgi:hypothetical protein
MRAWACAAPTRFPVQKCGAADELGDPTIPRLSVERARRSLLLDPADAHVDHREGAEQAVRDEKDDEDHCGFRHREREGFGQEAARLRVQSSTGRVIVRGE